MDEKQHPSLTSAGTVRAGQTVPVLGPEPVLPVFSNSGTTGMLQLCPTPTVHNRVTNKHNLGHTLARALHNRVTLI